MVPPTDAPPEARDDVPDPAPYSGIARSLSPLENHVRRRQPGRVRRARGRTKVACALANELKAQPDSLGRLLDACVCLELIEHTTTLPDHAGGQDLPHCRQPARADGYINYSNQVMWKLWAHLEDAVREGTHRWQQAFGWDGPIFSHFFRTDEAKREFLMGMHGFGVISSPHVVAAFDLSRFHRLVDLGGATGHLAIAACRAIPHMRAVVFDLADAIGLAHEIVGTSPVAGRVELVAGDFFVDPLPEADLFALGRIVHDWTEEKVLRLLSRIV